MLKMDVLFNIFVKTFFSIVWLYKFKREAFICFSFLITLQMSLFSIYIFFIKQYILLTPNFDIFMYIHNAS